MLWGPEVLGVGDGRMDDLKVQSWRRKSDGHMAPVGDGGEKLN